MKKLLSGLCALVGLLTAGLGLVARFLPEERWEPLALLRIWWIPILVIGVLVFAAGVILLLLNRKIEKEDASDGTYVMASNEDIRARVRDLLKRAWGGPFTALVLCALPVAVVHVLVHLLLRPVQLLVDVVQTQILGSLSGMGLYLDLMVILSGGKLPDLSGLLAVVPGLGVLLLALLLVFEPMVVSRAAYFLRLLRGRKPSPVEVYGVFGPNYARALAGMAYRALWAFLWTAVAIVVPVGIYVAGIAMINAYPEVLNRYLLVLVPSVAGLAIGSFIALACVWVNRALAYCMTPCVLATQRNLAPHMAVRASRLLMRGNKCRVLGLWLSYLYYFIPALVAAGVLLLLPMAGSLLGLSEILTISLRRFSWILIGVNQLILVYVLPLAYSSFHAFYLERKRELQEDKTEPTEPLGTPRRRWNG